MTFVSPLPVFVFDRIVGHHVACRATPRGIVKSVRLTRGGEITRERLLG